MKLSPLPFALVAASILHANEPREVAEAGMRAWVSHDPKALYTISHPDLVSRMREARLIQFYVESHPEKSSIPKSGTDAEVVSLMCEALAEIVPSRDGRFVYEDRYVNTKVVGDVAVVTFEISVSSAGGKSKAQGSLASFVVKKKDGEWRFLWSPAVRIHTDLTWDPNP